MKHGFSVRIHSKYLAHVGIRGIFSGAGDLRHPEPQCAGDYSIYHSGDGDKPMDFMSGTAAVPVGKGGLSE